MTAQIGDIYRHGEKRYTCLRKSGGPYFDPKKYGFEPTSVMTSCRAGYRCEYEITPEALKLQTLYIHDGNGIYPEINGVGITEDENEEYRTEWRDAKNGERVRVRIARCGDSQIYENLCLEIPFTGKLLLADDFIDRYYVHMGLQRPFAYRTLLSFAFEEGRLKEIEDHSRAGEAMRRLYGDEAFWERLHEKDPNGFILPDFVRGSEMLEYLPEDIREMIWWR